MAQIHPLAPRRFQGDKRDGVAEYFRVAKQNRAALRPALARLAASRNGLSPDGLATRIAALRSAPPPFPPPPCRAASTPAATTRDTGGGPSAAQARAGRGDAQGDQAAVVTAPPPVSATPAAFRPLFHS
jgi:hypothetical protein